LNLPRWLVFLEIFYWQSAYEATKRFVD
jgi:hypothetical protein